MNILKLSVLALLPLLSLTLCKSNNESSSQSEQYIPVPGEKGDKGDKGDPGEKGDTGPQGPAGSNGQDGKDGKDGVDGQNGKDGKDGQDGADGHDGVNGKDGLSLLTGNGEPNAELGKIGDSYIALDTWNYYSKEETGWVLKGNIKGTQGEDGEDGVSITNVEINENGELIITLSNGQVINVGVIKEASVDHTVSFYCGEDLLGTKTVKNGQTVERPDEEMTAGYNINYWYTENDERWNFTGNVVTKDISIYANYTPKNYTVTFVDYGLNEEQAPESIAYYDTLPSLTNANASFVGWRTENNENIFRVGEHFNIANDVTLYSIWDLNPTADNGKQLTFNGGETEATYGLYPTTVIKPAQAALNAKLNEIEALNIVDDNGYYLYDGNYYVSTIANECDYDIDDYYVDEETNVTNGQKYWYRCDKIEWEIFNKEGDTYTLISKNLLDSRLFTNQDANSGHYEMSELRSWLNSDFYTNAFGYMKNNKVINTTLDVNGQEITDKIYIPSEEEFKSFKTEAYFTTNYAKMHGVWTSRNWQYPPGLYVYHSSAWTRTLAKDTNKWVRYFTHKAEVVGCTSPSQTIYGVIPMMRISIS